MLQRGKEQIAAGQKTTEKHLSLNIVQYEFENLAFMRTIMQMNFLVNVVHELRKGRCQESLS